MNWKVWRMATANEYLMHHGIKGMKWGVQRTDEQLGHDTASTSVSKKNINPNTNTTRRRAIIGGIVGLAAAAGISALTARTLKKRKEFKNTCAKAMEFVDKATIPTVSIDKINIPKIPLDQFIEKYG